MKIINSCLLPPTSYFLTPTCIAVVGAGGKSTLIENLAEKFAAENKKVCITTTTHIYKNHDRENIFYAGTDEGEKLSYPGDENFSRLCASYDVVLVEADGSKHFPIKIPNENEPVIPSNVNEIFVVMGLNALGRPVGEVCQRFDKEKLIAKFPGIDEKFLVNDELINFIAEKFYIRPLKKNFPDTKINFIKNNFLSLPTSCLLTPSSKVALILLASGMSKRFEADKNKLFYKIHGKEIFRYGLEALINAKKILSKNKINSQVFITGGNIKEYEDVKIIDNPDRLEGIAGSIRHGTEAAIKNNCNAVLFFAADMPNFPAEDIAELVREFLFSKKLCGCAFSNYPANPGIFAASMYKDLLKLSGDTGALKIIRKNPEKTHYYVVRPEKLFDIDILNDTADF